MTISKVLRVALATVTGLTLALVSEPSSAATTESQKVCNKIDTQVRLTAATPTTYKVVGWLCSGPQLRDGQGNITGTPEVQFLVSGLTYDHNYWDWPGFGGTYSYVDAATIGGFVTFSYDRLGTGESANPPNGDIRIVNEAYVAAQLVARLRSGTGLTFHASRVIGVGHSLGAGILTYNASAIGVDAMVLTGFLHDPNLPHILYIRSQLYPADQDPKFSSKGLPAGYLTTRPGTRGTAFYNLNYAEPQVVAVDEQLKVPVPSGVAGDLPLLWDPIYTRPIQVPVLLVVGEKDALWCSDTLSCSPTGVLARESAAFNPAICLSIRSLTYAGHDINLHNVAQSFFWHTDSWLHNEARDPNCQDSARWI